MNITKVLKLFASLSCLAICGLAADAHADLTCRPCPFDCGGIGAGSDHCSSRGIINGQCCVDLDHKGQRILQDTDAVNSNRQQYGNQGYGNQGYGNQGYSGCPAGYSERAQKCSDSERAQGCHDMRSNNGGSCVMFDNHVGSYRAPGQGGGNYRPNRRR